MNRFFSQWFQNNWWECRLYYSERQQIIKTKEWIFLENLCEKLRELKGSGRGKITFAQFSLFFRNLKNSPTESMRIIVQKKNSKKFDLIVFKLCRLKVRGRNWANFEPRSIKHVSSFYWITIKSFFFKSRWRQSSHQNKNLSLLQKNYFKKTIWSIIFSKVISFLWLLFWKFNERVNKKGAFFDMSSGSIHDFESIIRDNFNMCKKKL